MFRRNKIWLADSLKSDVAHYCGFSCGAKEEVSYGSNYTKSSQGSSLPFLSPKPHRPQQLFNCSSQVSVFHLCLCVSNSYPISLSLSYFFCFSLLSHMLVFVSFFLLLYSFFLQRNLICPQFLPFPTPFCSSQSHNKSLVTSFIHSAQVVESSLGMGERDLLKLWTAINN